jgi:hypothetical protein
MNALAKNNLDVTLKQIASVTKARYDGQYFKKGSKAIKVQVLKNPDYATNYNKSNQTLYVASSDVRFYSRLKSFLEKA